MFDKDFWIFCGLVWGSTIIVLTFSIIMALIF